MTCMPLWKESGFTSWPSAKHSMRIELVITEQSAPLDHTQDNSSTPNRLGFPERVSRLVPQALHLASFSGFGSPSSRDLGLHLHMGCRAADVRDQIMDLLLGEGVLPIMHSEEPFALLDGLL